MSEQPWMPLYVGDYLMDTVDLSYEEHGIYLIMLMFAWKRNGVLPGDIKTIRRMLPYMHGRVFNRVVPSLLNRFFYRTPEGNWTQKRLQKELKHARNLSETQKENARKRWGKDTQKTGNSDVVLNKTNGLGHATAYATAHPTAMPSDMPARAFSQSQSQEEESNLLPEYPSSNNPNSSNGKYAFQHGCVRLTQADLDKWQRAFPHVSVEGELMAKEPWLAKQASWFNAAAGWLAKAERQAKQSGHDDDEPTPPKNYRSF